MSKTIRILVVEDEWLIAGDIKVQLESLQYSVVVATSYEDALRQLEGAAIDLVILDINLKGEKDGIDLASYINENYRLPYIFLSSLSSPDVVERAKNVHPYAYLIKPFNLREIQIALELALVNFSKDMRQDSRIAEKPEGTIVPIDDGLFLKNKDRYEKVLFDEIRYLEASSNYTTIYTEKSSYVYSQLLRTFDGKLPAETFLRVHRSFMVNIRKVDGFQGNILYIGPESIPVSRPYRSEVFRLLQGL